MPSPYFKPESVSNPSPSGGEAGLGHGAESAHAAMSGQEAAHAAAAKASAEATALASHTSVGHAAIGHAAIAAGPVPGAEQAVSPIIQLIMRLPGAVGLTHSFFEWLSNMFLGGGHDMMTQGLGGLADPGLFQHMDFSGHAAALNSATGLIHASQHFTVSIGGLPTDMGPMTGANPFSTGASGMLDRLTSPSFSSVPEHFMQNPANVGAGADLSHAQFEHGTGDALAGPSVTNAPAANFLSGNQRLFSDGLPSGSNFSSITSNTSVPTTTNAIPTSNGVTFGQEAGNMPAAHGAEAAMSGPSVGGGNGMELAKSSAPSIEGSSGSSLTDKFGSNNVVATDSPVYRPTTGGFYRSDAATSASSSNGMGGDVTPLKAKQLTFEDIRKGVVGDSGKRLMDQIAAGKHPTPASNAVDSVGHAPHAGGSQTGVDSIGHRTIPKAYSTSVGSHETPHAVAHESSHTVSHASSNVHHFRHQNEIAARTPAQHVDHAAQQTAPKSDASSAQQPDASGQQTDASAQQSDGSTGDATEQQADAGDQTQPAEATEYTVEKGDCLWNIAEKQLGDGSRWTEIYKMNQDVVGQNPDLIFSGTHLKLPGADQIADAGKYVVKPGDNLWNIAKHQLHDANKWGDLYKANSDVIGANPRLILPGQQLDLPGANPSMAAASAPAGNVPLASAAGQPPVGMDATQMAAPQAATPQVSMQSTGFEQSVPQAAIQQNAIPQAMPQAAAPQHAPVVSMDAGGGADSGMAVTTNGVITAMPQHELPVGPGAAGAATLRTVDNSVVSSSLAPDLSFLSKKPAS